MAIKTAQQLTKSLADSFPGGGLNTSLLIWFQTNMELLSAKLDVLLGASGLLATSDGEGGLELSELSILNGDTLVVPGQIQVAGTPTEATDVVRKGDAVTYWPFGYWPLGYWP